MPFAYGGLLLSLSLPLFHLTTKGGLLVVRILILIAAAVVVVAVVLVYLSS
jgi:hypothetical protein